MKVAIVVFALSLALVATAALVYRFARQRSHTLGNFVEWVKNPEYKRGAEEYFAARRSLTVPENISDAEIRRMVDRLFVEKDDDFNVDRLELVGGKAVPFLVAALEDPKTSTTYFYKDRHALAPKSPFERICDLLYPLGPPEAALPLAKYVEHQDDHFRKHAALELGNIGTAECIEPMLKALSDDDDYVRCFAMMGIERGMRASRCSKQFLDAMFPALVVLLSREDRSISDKAPKLLLAIDASRALPILLSPEYLTISNSGVHFIIQALNQAGHKIPHETLLPFLNTVKPQIDKYPHDYEYAEALKAYANNPDADAESTFRAALKSSNQQIQEAAAEVLGILSGVFSAERVVFDALDDVGIDGLSTPQKHYCAVYIYDGEVNNGGHSQYFVNSSGDHWKSAIEGLEAIGAAERATILREATALFGRSGPSEDDERRHEQLARFSSKQDQSLDALDDRYYKSKENVHALLAQYVVAHKDHFITE